MLKRILTLSLLPLLLAGCAARMTNLTPKRQVRNDLNQYPVEVSFRSQQQSLRWDSVTPEIVVGNNKYPMHRVMYMTNRWEGLLPVPPDATAVRYHYKFNFLANAFGKAPVPDSAVSPEYTLRLIGQ